MLKFYFASIISAAQHFYEIPESDPDPGLKTYGAGSGSPTLITSVVDLDPNFRFNADTDSDSERHQNDANPYADPSQDVLYTIGKSEE